MKRRPVVTVTDSPHPRVEIVVGEGLRRYNAEQSRGCRAAVLYTSRFQAPGFYVRRGWRVFGEIPCDPPGSSRIFMTKTL